MADFAAGFIVRLYHPVPGSLPQGRIYDGESRIVGSWRHASDNFKRPDNNLLSSRVVAIEMMAMAKDMLTVLGRGHEAHCGFINAPQGAGPASFGEWRMRLRITRGSREFRFVVCLGHAIT
jgi:hypothetical protein